MPKKSEKTARNRWTQLDSRIVFYVCDAFVNGKTAEWIAHGIKERFKEPLHRTQAYRILAEGQERGFFQLTPPYDLHLTERMMERFVRSRRPESAAQASSGTEPESEDKKDARPFKDPKDITVVSRGLEPSLDHVTAATAKIAAEVISDLYARRYAKLGKKPPNRLQLMANGNAPAVHVGFGAGATTQRVARRLAERLRGLDIPPRIVLHALSSGFSVSQPATAPVAFFSYFDGMPGIEFRGLFASAYATEKEWEKMRYNVGVRESFDSKGALDVIITSLATVDDQHGELNRFMALNATFGPQVKEILDKNERREGDVMYRPFSSTRPITREVAIRAVTLFELEELVAFAKQDDHAVILVAGPCAECKKSRTRALVPLLLEPALAVWTHLVTDDITAEECLARTAPRGR